MLVLLRTLMDTHRHTERHTTKRHIDTYRQVGIHSGLEMEPDFNKKKLYLCTAEIAVLPIKYQLVPIYKHITQT